MKFLAALLALAFTAAAADAPKPLRILLITGGCCHDYPKQKDLLKAGLEARVNCVIEHAHSDDKSTKPPLPIFDNPEYAKGYDLVIHDECAGAENDIPRIQGVLAPHKTGVPGVNLHCAMHSYRFGNYGKPVATDADNGKWYEYLGLQSTGHGPQEPIDIAFVDKEHPITKGLADWTTIKEELYNNIHVHPGAHVLAKGKQLVKKKKKDSTGAEIVEEKTEEAVVAWTNLYLGKARIFSTTIGHNNATVEDPRYLDLVARGVLWATDKIEADGKAKKGFGK